MVDALVEEIEKWELEEIEHGRIKPAAETNGRKSLQMVRA
jgi:hypothetical protein